MRKLSVLSIAVAAMSVGTSAYAADLIISEPAPMMIDNYAPANGWEGAYVGIHGGYASGDVDSSTGTTGDHGIAGGFLGAQLGYNFMLTEGLVLGVQGDISWANISGTEDYGFVEITDSVNWTGSATLHLGFDGGVFMPYVLGGLAFANNEHSDDFGGFTDDSQTHIGYTVGAGVAFMVTEQVSAFVEARYSDYGTKTYDLGGINPDISLSDTSLRAGVNFHF
ncbi:outer membrane protein [Devosia sp.]|uniref:outer membrane protein n=1 Tax=Devosia sp. TaxID=1871048 RepID=UPI003A95A138